MGSSALKWSLDSEGVDSTPAMVFERLDVVANSWTVFIIAGLADGPIRFGQLVQKLPGISHKTLSQRLKTLERLQLVEREQYLTIPPKVIYWLSPQGRTLVGLAITLLDWAKASTQSKVS